MIRVRFNRHVCIRKIYSAFPSFIERLSIQYAEHPHINQRNFYALHFNLMMKMTIKNSKQKYVLNNVIQHLNHSGEVSTEIMLNRCINATVRIIRIKI